MTAKKTSDIISSIIMPVTTMLRGPGVITAAPRRSVGVTLGSGRGPVLQTGRRVCRRRATSENPGFRPRGSRGRGFRGRRRVAPRISAPRPGAVERSYLSLPHLPGPARGLRPAPIRRPPHRSGHHTGPHLQIARPRGSGPEASLRVRQYPGPGPRPPPPPPWGLPPPSVPITDSSRLEKQTPPRHSSQTSAAPASPPAA